MLTHAEVDGTTTMPDGALNLPGVPEPADEEDVMREQLEYLINHTNERGICDCSECQRYLRARSVLLEIFSDPEARQIRQPTATLPMAA